MLYRTYSHIYLLLFIVLIISGEIIADGTRELVLTGGATSTRLQIGTDQVSNFGTYTSTPEKRIYIHIEDPATEKIYMGFGSHYHVGGDTSTLYYRIKDPNGNIVSPGKLVPVADTGYIRNLNQAIAGPNGLDATSGGYIPITFQPALKGDYYIEFSTDNTENKNEAPGNRVIFENIDISVGTNSKKIPGRLWAYTWNLYSCGFENPSFAKFFIYTPDSAVSRVDLNGMQPCGFSLMANSKGTSSSQNITESRQSTFENTSFPEYKIFLSSPDTLAYPSYTQLLSNKDLTLNGCFNSNYCIQINPTKPSTGEILIDFNGNSTQDPEDRKITVDLNSGDTCIPWDGKDALGNIVQPGTVGKIILRLNSDLINFPIFDPEHNNNGIKVDEWKLPTFPSGRPAKVYWDDSNLNLPAGAQVTNFTGCLYTQETSQGCHKWNGGAGENGAGNNNTMNTWWYANEYNDTVAFTITTAPVINAGQDIVLCDRVTQFNLGTGLAEPGVTYLWREVSPETTTITDATLPIARVDLNNSTKTNIKYYLTASNGGCTAVDTVMVTFGKPSKPVIVGKQAVCPNEQDVQYWLIDSNAIAQTWSVISGKTISPNANADTVSVDNWGTGSPLPIYDSVKVVTEYLGTCPKDSAYFKVEIGPDIITPKPIGDSVFCFGTTAVGNYIVPASQNSVFTWYVDGSPVPGNNTNKIQVNWDNPPASHTIFVYEVSTTTQVCADSSDILPILFKPRPDLITIKDTSTCSGVPLDLGPLVNAQPGGSSYQWTPANHLSSNTSASPVFQNSSPNGETIQYIFKAESNGCSFEDTINIKVRPLPKVVNITTIEACEDSTVNYVVKDSLGTSREWFVYDADTITKTYDFTALNPTNDTIKVKWGKKGTNAIVKVVTKGLCGNDTAVVNVLVRTYEHYKPSGDSGLCFAGPVTLPYTVRGNGGGKFDWTLKTQPESGVGSIVSSEENDTIQITWTGIGSAQLYVVESGAEDSSCITRPDTLYITITDKGSVDAGLDTSICVGQSAVLTAVGGSQYEWTPGNLSGSTVTVSPATTTEYIVKLLDPCKATDTVKVFVSPLPTTLISENFIKFCSDDPDTVPLRAKPGYTTYLWTPGGETDSLIFIEKSTLVFDEAYYYVTVEDSIGCKGSDTILLRSECPPLFFVPEAFSPNGDGANDFMKIFGEHFIDFEMRIFNRWGEVIYLTRNREQPWDGTYLGKPMPMGTYPWTATYRSRIDNDPENPRILKGSITLVR